MRKFSQILYIGLVKPILFLFPPDDVHVFFLKVGRMLGKYESVRIFFSKIWSYENRALEQNICGLNFKNPIGLSAGFDYNADLVEILPSIGFGFHSIGTLTHEAYGGNPLPMLARLPKSRSLLVNKGFKNDGVKKVLSGLNKNISLSLRGVSVGSTNKQYEDFESMIGDIVSGFMDAENFADFDYYELNISCPNLLNLQNLKEQLASSVGLRQLLINLEQLNLQRPVFIKMPLERNEDELGEMMQVAKDFPLVRGLIFSNLVKDRKNEAFNTEEIKKAGQGNFSGKPVEEKSNQVLRYAYKNYGQRFVLIGVGGVFTAEDAYRKILLGASLVQMITGLVFMGPEQVGIINKGLVALLEKDGYHNIQEAVGSING